MLQTKDEDKITTHIIYSMTFYR